MMTRINTAATAGAMALGLLAALSSAASAQPSGKAAAFFPHPNSPASSVGDASKAATKCDCPMMAGAPATPPKG